MPCYPACLLALLIVENCRFAEQKAVGLLNRCISLIISVEYAVFSVPRANIRAMPAHAEISAAKVRNLQGQWGNVVSGYLLSCSFLTYIVDAHCACSLKSPYIHTVFFLCTNQHTLLMCYIYLISLGPSDQPFQSNFLFLKLSSILANVLSL